MIPPGVLLHMGTPYMQVKPPYSNGDWCVTCAVHVCGESISCLVCIYIRLLLYYEALAYVCLF